MQGSPVCTNKGKIPPIFDKRDIREGLGGGWGHKAMIPVV
jgi:hypothetical protein